MAIDYTLELNCEPKRRFGRDGLAERLRFLEALQTELALTREQEARVREVVFELRPVAFHCSRCPANHRNREFGCYGRVETPVSAEAEEWLAELLPITLTPGGDAPPEVRVQAAGMRRLLTELNAAGVTGRPCEERRGGGRGALLERRQPLWRKWGSPFRRQRVGSGQLFEALLLRDTISPALAEALLRALGVWEDGGDGEDGTPEVYFTTPIEGDDDPSVAQVKLLLYALLTACSLGLAVSTEPEPERPFDRTAEGPESAPEPAGGSGSDAGEVLVANGA
jgi:hypothetical protein